MHEIIEIITRYRGEGWLALLYAAALLLILVREKRGGVRIVLGILPLCLLLVFMLQPVYGIYTRIDGKETYYRLLWFLPVSATLAYAGVMLPELLKGGGRRLSFVLPFLLACALVVAGGDYTYDSVNITRAENRLHLPQTVIDLCDYIVSAGDGSRNIQVAFPSEHVHYVRQYTTDIRLSFGREMMVDRWGFDNPVYEQMEVPEMIDAKELSKALLADECRFVVLSAARRIDGDLSDYGYEKKVLLDGYYVYKNESLPPA